jgi:hypothetical protein
MHIINSIYNQKDIREPWNKLDRVKLEMAENGIER